MVCVPVTVLPCNVQRKQSHKTADLHEEVDENGEPGIERKCVDRWNGGHDTNKEAGALGGRREKHGGGHLANDASKVLCHSLSLASRGSLERCVSPI